MDRSITSAIGCGWRPDAAITRFHYAELLRDKRDTAQARCLIRRSSYSARWKWAVDEAVRRIVESQKPYPAFPPALAREYDVVEIRRTWHFDTAIRLD